VNKRRLGRGLEALLGREEGGFEGGSLDASELIQIAVDQIDANPFQPRRLFNSQDIASLADSLRQHGMLQPVLVRAVGDRYQLSAAGEPVSRPGCTKCPPASLFWMISGFSSWRWSKTCSARI
jgi:hypothetical protein